MTDFSRWDAIVVARKMVHLDGTTCGGSRCAWRGDGGHIVRDPGGGYVPSWVERRMSDIEYGNEEHRDGEAATIAQSKHWGVHVGVPTVDVAINLAMHTRHEALTGDWQTGDSWAAWGEPVDREEEDKVHLVMFFRAGNPDDAERIGQEIVPEGDHVVTTAAMYSAQLPLALAHQGRN